MGAEMILVTGAAGNCGSAVIREFVRNEIPVRALVRNGARADKLPDHPLVHVVEADMASAATLGPALEGVERALLISSADPQMVVTQCRFIDACRAAGVAQVVKMSGKESGVGFQPENFRFTRMHQQIEQYLEGCGVPWTHLRPSQFMQVYLREVRSIASDGELRLPFNDIRLSPVDIADVAKIAFSVLVKGGQEGCALDFTGPEALSMADIADRISEATGRAVKYRNIGLEERQEALRAAGTPQFMLDALEEQAIERRRHANSAVMLGPFELFGLAPTTFAEFARRHAAEFRGEG